MKRITFFIITIIAGLGCSAQTLQNEADSASYAIGLLQGINISQSLPQEFNSSIWAYGIFDIINKNNNLKFPIDSAEAIANRFIKKLQKAEEEKMQENCLANSEFLLKNGKEKGVVTLENGLQYKVITKGSGKETPGESDKVTIHYVGKLIDGTTFDSSVDRGAPATFPVEAVIPGFAQTLQLMTVGSKYIAYIPSELGYGMQDKGTIKPCSTLIFEIELLNIIKNNEDQILNPEGEIPEVTVDEESDGNAKKAKKSKKNK